MELCNLAGEINQAPAVLL